MIVHVDDGFTDVGLKYINKTIETFEIFNIDEKMNDVGGLLTTDGASLDPMFDAFDFYISGKNDTFDNSITNIF